MRVLNSQNSRVIALLVPVLAGTIWTTAGKAWQANNAMTLQMESPTGKWITPDAAVGAIFQDLDPQNAAAPELRAHQAAAVSVSPDRRMLAILTSGYNVIPGADGKMEPPLPTEYVFLFDITGQQPRQAQVLSVPEAFPGLAWAPTSDRLFASGGVGDSVVEFARNGSSFVASRTFRLGHRGCLGRVQDSSATAWAYLCGPQAAGVAISPDGARLLVANFNNDSVSLLNTRNGEIVAEQDLRPGVIDPRQHGRAGGSFPRDVVWVSQDHAYVASERDREVLSLSITGGQIRVSGRIPVRGAPVALLANRTGSRVYVALDTTSQVAILDTSRERVIETLDVAAPKDVFNNSEMLGGANTNALALTPDGETLLVSDGGENAVAVVRLSDRSKGLSSNHAGRQNRKDDEARESTFGHSWVAGLVPTGEYPTGVATSGDGRTWYIINGKSPPTANSGWCQSVDPDRNLCVPEKRAYSAERAANGWNILISENQMVEQKEKAGFLTMPAPEPRELVRLTKQVAHNNRFDHSDRTAANARLFSFLRAHIKHIIYVMKENRTYDQVLGDLEVGNGDPRLTLFPKEITPNHHAIARTFVTLDNFLVSGEGSWTGWDWTFSAQTSDLQQRMEPLTFPPKVGWGGTPSNRGINVGFATSGERWANDPTSSADPDILPGTHNVFDLDGPDGEVGKGTLWDAALRKGLTVRSWGIFADGLTQAIRRPFEHNVTVAWSTNPTLMAYTDPYFHAFDLGFPDFWRLQEWKREFAEYVAAKKAPELMLVELPGDHLGDFGRAIDGVNTPETQMADDDYALGLMIETVANSPFARDTLIISIEDDPCDGPDHVSAQRSIALVAGPYVRQNALVSMRYTTVSVVKTIEEILGIGPIGLNDALAAPMFEVFDTNVANWTYNAIVPDVLYSTQLPLPPADHAVQASPRHPAGYWTKAMAGQDFSGPDRVNPASFNRALWRGLRGDERYPVTGVHVRSSPAQFLAKTQPGRGHRDNEKKEHEMGFLE